MEIYYISIIVVLLLTIYWLYNEKNKYEQLTNKLIDRIELKDLSKSKEDKPDEKNNVESLAKKYGIDLN
jgi:cell division protein FtsL